MSRTKSFARLNEVYSLEKPKFGIFVIAFYKENLNVEDPSVHSGILGAACDVIKFALELEKAEGIGKQFLFELRVGSSRKV